MVMSSSLSKILGDVELRGHVVLHLVVVAVQVVRGDVGDDGDVRLEIIHVVQLEAADFQDIVIEMLGRDLIGVGLADVAAEAHVQAGVLQQVVDQGRGRGLAVGAGDADLLRGVEAARELDLGHDVRALLPELPHQGNGARDARGLDDLVGVEDQALRVVALLEGDFPLLEFIDILLLDLSLVRQEHVEPFDLCENGCAHSAFGAAQNDYSAHI